VHCVVLQHVCKVIYWAKVVDTYYLNVIASLSCAEYETTDTAKSVNTNLCHFTLNIYLKGLINSLFTIFYLKKLFFLFFGCKVTKKYLILQAKAVLNSFKRTKETR